MLLKNFEKKIVKNLEKNFGEILPIHIGKYYQFNMSMFTGQGKVTMVLPLLFHPITTAFYKDLTPTSLYPFSAFSTAPAHAILTANFVQNGESRL